MGWRAHIAVEASFIVGIAVTAAFFDETRVFFEGVEGHDGIYSARADGADVSRQTLAG